MAGTVIIISRLPIQKYRLKYLNILRSIFSSLHSNTSLKYAAAANMAGNMPKTSSPHRERSTMQRFTRINLLTQSKKR